MHENNKLIFCLCAQIFRHSLRSRLQFLSLPHWQVKSSTKWVTCPRQGLWCLSSGCSHPAAAARHHVQCPLSVSPPLLPQWSCSSVHCCGHLWHRQHIGLLVYNWCHAHMYHAHNICILQVCLMKELIIYSYSKMVQENLICMSNQF